MGGDIDKIVGTATKQYMAERNNEEAPPSQGGAGDGIDAIASSAATQYRQDKQWKDAVIAKWEENRRPTANPFWKDPYDNPFYAGIVREKAQRRRDFSGIYRYVDRLQSMTDEANDFYGSWHSQEEQAAFRKKLGIDSALKALEGLKGNYSGKDVEELEDYLTQLADSIGQNESYWANFGSQEEYDGFQRYREQMAGPLEELRKAAAAAESAQQDLETFQQSEKPKYDDPKYIQKYLDLGYNEEAAANLANDDYINDLCQYEQESFERQCAKEAAEEEWVRQQYAVEEARLGYLQNQLDNLLPTQLPAWALGEDNQADEALAEAEAAAEAAWKDLEAFQQQEKPKYDDQKYLDQGYDIDTATIKAGEDYTEALYQHEQKSFELQYAAETAEKNAENQRNLKHNRDVDVANLQEIHAMSEEDKEAFLRYMCEAAILGVGSDDVVDSTGYWEALEALSYKYDEQRVQELAETYVNYRNRLNTEETALKAGKLARTGGAAVIPAYLLSFPAKLIGSVSGTLSSLADKLGGTGQYVGFNPYSFGNLPNVYADTLRSTMAGEIKGDGSSGWRNFASYGFQAVNSAGDSLLRAVVAGPYSLGLSASATFNDTILDATKKGASTGEAVLLGVLNAGIETATEKIPLDNLLDNLGKNPGDWWNILMKAGGQGLIECSTEELSFIGTTLTEAAILRQNSDYATTVRELEASGRSKEDAIAEANKRLLEEAKETAIVSFLSGEMSSVGSSAIGAMRNPLGPNTEMLQDVELRQDAIPEQAGVPEGNGWRSAADLAKQEDLSVMDALNRAGLSGSADLARLNPQAYAQSFQNALKGGASYDQALIRATSDSTMRIVGNQVPMGTLLYNIGGDPNKAVSAIGGALNRAGISMTPGELKLLGIVAAEASAYQQDPSFQRDVAIEMLKQNSKEAAWTAASEKLWQEATNRVIAHGIADLDLEEKEGPRRKAKAGLTPQEKGQRYRASKVNQLIMQMIDLVKQDKITGKAKVPLGIVPDSIAVQIYRETGVDVHGYQVALEARQIKHILKRHGENGSANHSMADPKDIARMEYALHNPDRIEKSDPTETYVTNRDGKMRPADTVLYEAQLENGSYYVVQAVPETKKKTLYIVTAFIGEEGYRSGGK